MVKKKRKTSKKTKKTTRKKRAPTKRTVKHESDIRVEKVLIENFVALQKVMVTLSSKFEDLSLNIKKLLDLFENAAKSLAKDGPDPTAKKEAENIMKKLDGLADQNKIIARGLTLMHETNLPIEENYAVPPQMPPRQMAPPVPKPTPGPSTMPSTAPIAEEAPNMAGYQKSISEER